MSERLTAFQVRTCQTVEQLLSERNVSFSRSCVEGDLPKADGPDEEAYVEYRFTLGDTPVAVWIYYDQAEFQCRRESIDLEQEDFRSEDELERAFIAAFRKLLAGLWDAAHG